MTGFSKLGLAISCALAEPWQKWSPQNRTAARSPLRRVARSGNPETAVFFQKKPSQFVVINAQILCLPSFVNPYRYRIGRICGKSKKRILRSSARHLAAMVRNGCPISSDLIRLPRGFPSFFRAAWGIFRRVLSGTIGHRWPLPTPSRLSSV